MADAATSDAGSTDTGDTDAAATQTTTTDEGAKPDADAEKWKELARKHERQAKKALADLEKTQQASMSEQEKAVAAARAAARQEAHEEFQRERIKDKVQLAAAGKLADPGDAPALLGDLDQFFVGGDIDEKSIAGSIEKLLAAKPYLGVKPGGGSGEGGPRGQAAVALNGDPLVRTLEEKLGAPRR